MDSLPVGRSIEIAIDFLTRHYAESLGSFSSSLTSLLENFVGTLLRLPSWVVIATLTALTLVLRRRIKLGLLMGLGLWLIDNMGYWQATIETLTLVSIATFISACIGIPLGIVVARRPSLYSVLQPVLDMMQTIPTFVYLIPTLMLFGLGIVPGLISTIIFAVPAPIRATYLGIRKVPSSLTEVGAAFGASSWQTLFKIELPYARTMILAGVTQCLMLSLSMVVIAALVGADGLGKPVLQALNTVNVGKGFEAGLAIVILAVILDRSLIAFVKE